MNLEVITVQLQLNSANIFRNQQAYETAVDAIFSHLDRAEAQLSSSTAGPYYFGDRLTGTDIRLYVTIIRFDPVYVQHFKCNIRDIRHGYPRIHAWLRHLYWNHNAFQTTTEFEHIKRHYMESHIHINPRVSSPYPSCYPADAANATGHCLQRAGASYSIRIKDAQREPSTSRLCATGFTTHEDIDGTIVETETPPEETGMRSIDLGFDKPAAPCYNSGESSP
jgi:hypothetical protein